MVEQHQHKQNGQFPRFTSSKARRPHSSLREILLDGLIPLEHNLYLPHPTLFYVQLTLDLHMPDVAIVRIGIATYAFTSCIGFIVVAHH